MGRHLQHGVEILLKHFNGKEFRIRLQQVPFVELNHEGNRSYADPFFRQVLGEVDQTFNILLSLNLQGIRHKDNPVHPLQNQFSGCIVMDLSGNRIELDTDVKASDLPRLSDRKSKKRVRSPFVSMETIFPRIISSVFV